MSIRLLLLTLSVSSSSLDFRPFPLHLQLTVPVLCAASGKYLELIYEYSPLDSTDTISFTGTFKTINSVIQGTVALSLFNHSYFCATNLPFGHGAGKIQIENTTIDFIDTLFFPIPAIYGPSYVLSGKHEYSFNGENLEIWKNKNIGSIEYHLRK